MTALVSMFNFLRLYLDYFTCIIFGGIFSTEDYTGEFHRLAYNICAYIIPDIPAYYPDGVWYLEVQGNPYLFIPIGIFAIGSVIGLVRRLVKG